MWRQKPIGGKFTVYNFLKCNKNNFKKITIYIHENNKTRTFTDYKKIISYISNNSEQLRPSIKLDKILNKKIFSWKLNDNGQHLIIETKEL